MSYKYDAARDTWVIDKASPAIRHGKVACDPHLKSMHEPRPVQEMVPIVRPNASVEERIDNDPIWQEFCEIYHKRHGTYPGEDINNTKHDA